MRHSNTAEETRFTVLRRVGFVLYVGAFFLPAVAFEGSWRLGYDCAWLALVAPWLGNLAQANPPLFASLLISGLINPAFVLTAMASNDRVGYRGFQIVTCLMIPACWATFYLAGMYPLVGHVVWIAGMFLVMFAPAARSALVAPEEAGLEA